MQELYMQELDFRFIQNMVQCMYKYECSIVEERLLTEDEMFNFYDAFIQGASIKPNTR